MLHGIDLPADMVESLRSCLEPLFTPSTKESSGHDINISVERACEIVGEEAGRELETNTLAVYIYAASHYAAERGMIICDTKFEFG